jgi:hypothetical protein
MSKNGIAWLPTKEARQIAKLELAAAKRGESYDRDLLPTKYVDNDVVNNPNTGGLQPHRPWIDGPPPPPVGNADIGWYGDQNFWIYNGGIVGASSFSFAPDPVPTYSAYTYPDGNNGHTYNFAGAGDWMISMNLSIGGAWQNNVITIDYWFYPTANGIQLMSEIDSSSVSALYHYTMLEIDGTGHIKARFWNGTPITSTNTVTLNSWNHIYFTENSSGVHVLEVNGIATTNSQVYVRQKPTTEYIIVGNNDGTNMGSTGRFQGKIGYLELHDYIVASTFVSRFTRFMPTTANVQAGTQSNDNNGSNAIHIDSNLTTDAWASTVPVGAIIVVPGYGTYKVSVILAPNAPSNPQNSWFFGLSPNTSNFPSGTAATFYW